MPTTKTARTRTRAGIADKSFHFIDKPAGAKIKYNHKVNEFMDEKELKILMEALEDQLPEKVVKKSSLPKLLMARFGYTFLDVCILLARCSDLFYAEDGEIEETLSALDDFFLLRSGEMRRLFLKNPEFLLLKGDVLVFRLKMLMVTLDVSASDAVNIVYDSPYLLYLSKSDILDQISIVGDKLGIDSENAKKFFRQDPRALASDPAKFEHIKTFLKDNLKLGEAKTCIALKNNPTVFVLGDVDALFGALYPRYFCLRDLRDIFSLCPQVMTLDAPELLSRIDHISSGLKLSFQKSSQALLLNAQLAMFGPERVSEFTSLGISRKYLAGYPSLLMRPKLSLFIKLMICRCMKLDKFFDEMVKIDCVDLVARLAFMRDFAIKDKSFLLLSEDAIKEKYHVTKELLRDEYKPSEHDIALLIDFYAKHCKPKGRALPFDTCTLISFLRGDEPTDNIIDTGAENCLMSSGYSRTEAEYILTCVPSLFDLSQSEYLSVLRLLQKFLRSREQAMALTLRKPNILICSARDLEKVILSLHVSEPDELYKLIEQVL